MKIHLHSRQGLYEVETYGRNSITCSTKHYTFHVPCDDFKSFAGGFWNHHVTKDDMDLFLSVVQPEKYKLQVQQENEIITLAARIDMITESVKASSTPTVVEEEEDILATKEDYERWYNEKYDELNKVKDHMRTIAFQVYSQDLDFTNFEMHKGIKFIIQQGIYDDNSFRFCWDPYGFVSNGHSDISSIFRPDDWYTINGGWIKIIGDDVILYYKSGDYGVYDDALAIECAKKLFPRKNIHSYAGRQWDEELDSKFFELPF
jgi:hypothetical protein